MAIKKGTGKKAKGATDNAEEPKITITMFYDALRMRYKTLPKYDAFDKEFDIGILEWPCKASDIRKRVFEKLDLFDEILELYIEPEGFSSMVEIGGFSDKDKQTVFDAYKSLTLLMREAVKLTIDSDEKREVEYLNKAYAEWMRLKPKLQRIVDCAMNGWDTDYEEVRQGYFG